MKINAVKYIDLEIREHCCKLKDLTEEMSEELDLDAVMSLAHKVLDEIQELALHAIEIDKGSEK